MGPASAGRLAAEAACLVVVDVLSFTTAVSVAVETGIRVLPFWLPDGPATTAEQAAAVYARQSGARLAVARRAVTPDSPWSLSPAPLRRAPFVARLVLPSPNGAVIAAAAAPDVRVVAACLRNITAVGSWLMARGCGTPEHPVAVIAAGERWPDGSLRPALEDLLGAGALICDLHAQGAGLLSAEAAAAKAAYDGTADLTHAVAVGVSGRDRPRRASPRTWPSPQRRTSAPSYPYGIPMAPSYPAEPAGLTRWRRLQSSATLSSAPRGGPPAPSRAVCCVR